MRPLARLQDAAEQWATGQGLAGSEVRSLQPGSPFPHALHRYHYSGRSYYLESKGTGWIKGNDPIKQENHSDKPGLS